MTPPELGISAPVRKQGFWKRRSGLEKALLFVVGVAGVAMVAGGTYFGIKQSEGTTTDDETPFDAGTQEDICVTASCTVAAGKVIETMDLTADPCQDFFQFACGGWIANNEIPEAKSRWGKFYELRDDVDRRVKKIIESEKDANDAKSVNYLKDMYNGCMDLEAIETFGYKTYLNVAEATLDFPGWPMVYNSWDSSKWNLMGAIGGTWRYLYENVLLSTFVFLDEQDVSTNVLYVDQPSLFLPRTMYVNPENFVDIIDAYKEFIITTAQIMTRELGENVADDKLRAAVENVFAFETVVAKFTVPEEDRRNATELYNPTTLKAFKEKYPIDWDSYYNMLFADTEVTINDEERIIVREPDYFDGLLPILNATPENVVADYVYWRAIASFAGEGPSDLVAAADKFSNTISGTSQAAARSTKCIAKSASESSGFGYAVGHKYIETAFTDGDRDRVASLVENLIVGFKELVGEAQWMDDVTKELAKQKADAMDRLLGYPDWLPDKAELDKLYDGVRIPDVTTHVDNVVGVRSFSAKGELETLRKEPESNTWLTQPAIVNAFYSPNHNSITFPAGILQSPFFGNGEGYPRYLNYGAIGVVIGHEITHGFDDQGSQYDKDGNAIPWWSEDIIDAFKVKAKCFVDQYNNYTLPELTDVLGDEAHVNGQNTQGENIADNGGVRESFRAYTKSVAAEGPEKRLPGLQQFTPEQMFFVSYAQVWCEKVTLNGLLGQILSDPHSPGKFRVFGPLSNSEDFVREFKCPAGSPMNRGDDKCILW